MAEEFWCVRHREYRFHADAKSSDLTSTFLRHTHSKDCLCTLRSDGISFVGAVEMGFCEDYVNLPSGFVRDFISRILDELEKLAIAISALSDSSLSIGVLGYETGVYGVRLKDARRLLDDGFDYRRERRRHCSCTPDVSKVRVKA
ncbi:hypothetical protein AB5J56_27940 [Streptomyces sp. R21]|uniref:Uncharacterized protein n=1 Tax=Streptomyces sp. R21 TaxID=3238627 RepID=A0AB39PP13_9ACTN